MEYSKTERKRGGDSCCHLFSEDFGDTKKDKPSLFLHSCCGPCSTSVIETLLPKYKITVFFYNPNITDEEEYSKRRNSQVDFINKFNELCSFGDRVGFVEGKYEPCKFLEAARGFEAEPEGGKRCDICFHMRLEKTAAQAKVMGYDAFGTTLTVSPHKSYKVVSKLGGEISFLYGIAFLDMDFKKRAGFQRSIELSKKFDLYRQHFCGCKYST